MSVEVGDAGEISEVAAGADPGAGEICPGICVPGLPNVHSHSFQRAMSGLAERAGPAGDNFWTWRELMYSFANRVEPDDLHAISSLLYIEMLKGGYTAVGEYHYIHHDRSGRPYENISEASEAVIDAAREAGIAITHLPSFYCCDTFGQPALETQRRFVNSLDSFESLFSKLGSYCRERLNVNLGVACHSLRAVPLEQIPSLKIISEGYSDRAPLHAHVAEQEKEAVDCIAWHGKRPVQLLLDEIGIDDRWCLVHATHMDAQETTRLARSGAVAGLCPTTEANLGDGIFPLRAYLDVGGRIGIGSDNHISTDPPEELRWLEYAQRLSTGRRNVSADGAGRSTGRSLFRRAAEGGAQALGIEAGRIAPGYRADFVVLDGSHPSLEAKSGDEILDSWIFANHGSPVRDVIVGGSRVVGDGRHRGEEAAKHRFRAVMRKLAASQARD